jgi:hypothetical protein
MWHAGETGVLHAGFWLGELRERDHLEDIDGGDNIEIDLQWVGWRDIGWIDLAEDRERWRAVVNAVMNFRVS